MAAQAIKQSYFMFGQFTKTEVDLRRRIIAELHLLVGRFSPQRKISLKTVTHQNLSSLHL